MEIPFSKPVTLIRAPGTPAEQRLAVRGTVQPERGYFPVSTPIHEGDVIEAEDPRGGVLGLNVARVNTHAYGTEVDHLEVCWGDPSTTVNMRPSAVIQHFNGPVGAVQTGDGAIASVVQNLGTQVSEIAPLLDAVLRASTDLSTSNRHEVAEQLEELRAELASAKPKPSRVKAFLAAMWQVTQGVATVAPKLIELAEKLGHPLVPK